MNTFGVLTAAVMSSIRGRDRASAFGREFRQDHVNRALTVTLLSLGLVFGTTLTLSMTERFSLLQLLFETTSAFGTVGLSTGITPELSHVGKLVVIATMYVGRVGPLTVALALAQRDKPDMYHLPEGRVKNWLGDGYDKQEADRCGGTGAVWKQPGSHALRVG